MYLNIGLILCRVATYVILFCRWKMNNDQPKEKIKKLDEACDLESAVELECTTFKEHSPIQGLPFSETVTDPIDHIVTEREEVESNISEISAISGFSDLSNHGWEPKSESLSWLHDQMSEGKRPLDLLRELIPDIEEKIPVSGLDEATLWRMLVSLMSEPERRIRLRHISSLTDVIHLIRTSKKILVLTGAGVSVSCGIPDFRSRDGVYARLSKDFPDLPDPTAMFDIGYFRNNPRPFFQFAGELWPGQFKPSLCHRFIRHIEKNNQLLRNYTQNIDTLEQVAEIERVIQCHGSFSTATCMRCKHQVRSVDVEVEIKNKLIPVCKKCHPDLEEKEREKIMSSFGAVEDDLPPPVLKPDIVFFGEGLPTSFHAAMEADKHECDLLIVMGSSLKVKPVALIPTAVPPGIPQILINREPLSHMCFDIELLGDCDAIVNTLCHKLGNDWGNLCEEKELEEIKEMPINSVLSPTKATSDVKETTNVLTPPTSTVSSTEKPADSLESADAARKAEQTSRLAEVESDDEDAFLNIAEALPEGTYLFERPGRYVFPGAEYFSNIGGADDQSSDDTLEDSDESLSVELEITENKEKTQ